MKSHTDVIPEDATEVEPAPIDLSDISLDLAMSQLAQMVLIRLFELRAAQLVTTGEIFGGMHASIGQEAVAVGVISALEPGDRAAASHRSHHVALAKGMPPRTMMAELFGREMGSARGRGGHMHMADFDRGFLGSNGIVGASAGLALGSAFASAYRHDGRVAVGFFGDGGANTGRVWEFVNLAAAWSLPVIFVCENNGYAVETRIDQSMAGESIARRAEGFGLPSHQADGQDVAAMYRLTRDAAERARSGGGPTFIEALTYRHQGHDVGERGKYRTAEEIAWWEARFDPIRRLRGTLGRAGALSDEEFTRLELRMEEVVSDAVDYAEAAQPPDPATVADNVTGLVIEEGDFPWLNA
jgi:TPP-dependent pyruvate/acetoin dehydrogenase alpha subunit